MFSIQIIIKNRQHHSWGYLHKPFNFRFRPVRTQVKEATHFLILKHQFPCGAQCLCKTFSLFPSSAFTLRCLVPRCCRVMLQPGLMGQNSISFLWLQDAQTFVLKPDWSEHEVKRKAGLQTAKNHKPLIFK